MNEIGPDVLKSLKPFLDFGFNDIVDGHAATAAASAAARTCAKRLSTNDVLCDFLNDDVVVFKDFFNSLGFDLTNADPS